MSRGQLLNSIFKLIETSRYQLSSWLHYYTLLTSWVQSLTREGGGWYSKTFIIRLLHFSNLHSPLHILSGEEDKTLLLSKLCITEIKMRCIKYLTTAEHEILQFMVCKPQLYGEYEIWEYTRILQLRAVSPFWRSLYWRRHVPFKLWEVSTPCHLTHTHLISDKSNINT